MPSPDAPHPMKRVCVMGAGGSGKSTFSIALSDIIKSPALHHDKLFWMENWVERDKNDYANLHTQWINQDRWIIDGNGYSTMPERFNRADTIIFLDYPRLTSIISATYRAIKFHGKARPMMQDNCPEKLDINFLKFLIYIWNYKNTMRPKILNLMDTTQDKNILIFKNRAEASNWLNTLEK